MQHVQKQIQKNYRSWFNRRKSKYLILTFILICISLSVMMIYFENYGSQGMETQTKNISNCNSVEQCKLLNSKTKDKLKNKISFKADYKEYKYKKVNLQKLNRKNQTEAISAKIQKLVGTLDKQNQDQFYGFEKQQHKQKNKLSFQQKLYCYKDTAANDQRIVGEINHFFNAFFIPYSQHGDVFLVPDDIWLMISLYLSKYIDKNAERLRHHFVKHQGRKQLTIVEYANSIEESLQMEKQWDYFFQQIIKQIQKHTVEGVVEQLSCNFSTTNSLYKLISTSIVMSSLKKYFGYGRMIMACGLNNIYFAGTRQDWVKVQTKLKSLQKYDVDGELKKYVESVGIILQNFINTYDQKPDLKWWNTIMTSEQRREGSGNQKFTYIQGWILHFYGIYQNIQIEDIPQTSISVPIKLINLLTKTEKQLQLIADWVSVSKVNKYTYKPDIGMCIVERQRKLIE